MKVKLATAFAVALTATTLNAQDLETQEVIVTGSRIEQDDYSRDMPAVGLRRTADFLVQSIVIRGDSRDPKLRASEIRQMLKNAVQIAAQRGLQLAYGDYILTPLTLQNLNDITLKTDNRPDSERISFLIKSPLAGKVNGAAAEKQIQDFIEAVPEVGRAQMDESGDSSLSIVGPDQYRFQVTEKVMDDARALAAKMGANYAVTVEGLNMPVQWTSAGPSEVMLYVPYKLTIVPKP